ncbi:probable mannosyltransferase Ktr4p [[Candida] jaroonii]|uniref:Probable mannosyltransferase Ktr4p n=1 Tax=[Candida] jaroonii TaxID=467808 RepID=A0ACA9YCW8_9ASCO|nr:probable mannosyltransferase Ktr4p [[Candida] jaroonii]
MITALNIRPTRVLIVVIICVVLFTIGGVLRLDKESRYSDVYNYYLKHATDQYQPGTLDTYGYSIEPQNVKFKFINPKNKRGTPQQIVEQNNKVYEELVKQQIHEPKDSDLSGIRPPTESEMPNYDRADAVIIALVRNSELTKIAKTIKKFEKSFNSKFQYPYMFINDEPFSERFKTRMDKLIPGPKEFVTLPPELWNKPDSIDVQKQTKNMNVFHELDIAYAKKESYHNMCRFYSGGIFKLPELQKYRYYWRIEPDVQFNTEIDYDVFKYLQTTGKVYGFTVNLYDIEKSIETLWPETLKFLNKGDNYKYVDPNGSFQWLLENQQHPEKNKVTGGYSTCHFWSNFEIADMDFFRGEAYTEWFNHLDSTGNFYYERWGDAPVHSVGLGLFAPKDKIHWFRDIGYFHDPYGNCPNTSTTKICTVGAFSRWKHLEDQNCMTSWIQYSMEDPSLIY